MPLTLEIVTPTAPVYSDTVDTVVIPGIDGELGILPGHVPLLTVINGGELRVTKQGRTESLVVSGGFAQVAGDKVSILAEYAIEEVQIDEHAVENALKRAEEDLKRAEGTDPAEAERLEGVVRFAVAQLGVKRRR
ncbi:MAG TPA: ATP synthase F1 subunit epsilon [Opitutaceae bacterium]|jgi:F-type H+-transporting ATPase subunit epsilon|nr:ATP synthase F1 subunit epsilon [Opitutaceae bacterium]